MSLVKPRGSTHGLKFYQSGIRERTRKALLQAIQSLALDQSDSPWSTIQVCRKAGLFSSIALKKPWNSDLLNMVANHNRKVGLAAPSSTTSKLSPDEVTNLKGNLKLVRKLRSKLVIKDAELLNLERENKALRERVDRLEKICRLIKT